MEDKTVEYVLLGLLGISGFFIGWFLEGERYYKRYSKELEELLKQSSEVIDNYVDASNKSIEVRDELIETMSEIIYEKCPELREQTKILQQEIKKQKFTVLDKEDET